MRNLPLHLTKRMLEGEPMWASVPTRFEDSIAWVQLLRYRTGTEHLLSEAAAKLPWTGLIIRHFEMPNKFRSGEWEVSDGELLYLREHRVKTAEEADLILDELVGDPSKFIGDAELTEYTPF